MVEFACSRMDTAPRDVDFRFIGDYETWLHALSEKDNLTADVFSGKLEFYGNLAKLQPVLVPFTAAIMMQSLVRSDGSVIPADALSTAGQTALS